MVCRLHMRTETRRAFRADSSNPADISSNMRIRKSHVEAVKSMPERSNSWKKPKGIHSIDLVPKLQEVLRSKVTERCLVRQIGGCKVLLSLERGYNLKDFIESDESRSLQKAPKELENTGSVEINHLVRREKSLNTLLKGLTATPGGKKTSRKAKKKTLELTEEGSIGVLEGIDFSVASTTDSQIANVNKRVAKMREERNAKKI
ncbi:hypothetical protein Ancab_002236 [Ancistrocladus abbreviatus]